MDNFKAIYRILRYLEKAMDYDEADMGFISPESIGISEQRWAALMGMLVKGGCVDGISVKRSIDGDIAVSGASPRITLKGLECLNGNPMMQKAANIAKGIVETIP